MTLDFNCPLGYSGAFTNSQRGWTLQLPKFQDPALLNFGRSQPTMPLSRYCYEFGVQKLEQRALQRRRDRPFVPPTTRRLYDSLLTRAGLQLKWHRYSRSFSAQQSAAL
jgi:hypothetical protein